MDISEIIRIVYLFVICIWCCAFFLFDYVDAISLCIGAGILVYFLIIRHDLLDSMTKR